MESKEKPVKEEQHEVLVRVMGRDVPGSKNIFVGLTKIKGVSWALANATCVKLGLDKKTKLSELKKEDIGKIEAFLKNPDIYSSLKNRRMDFDSGEDKHLVSVDLSMRKDFDIKRLKKIKSYRGNRHSFGLPSRGQKTRSHFRGKGKAVGVKKPKKGKKG